MDKKEYQRRYYQLHKKERDKRNREWIKNHPEKRREWARRRYWQVGRIRSIDYLEAHYEWRRNHPEAISAHNKVSWAIKTGKLVRSKNCSTCNRELKLRAHHDDYSKPLVVLWLCASCHRFKHKQV